MAQIPAIILEAGALAEAAKKIQDGVSTTYNDVVSVFDSINRNYKILVGTATQGYDDLARYTALASFSWIPPFVYTQYLQQMSALNFSFYYDRQIGSAYLERISKINMVKATDRFPDMSLLTPFREPLLGTHLKLCWAISVPRTVTDSEFHQYEEEYYKSIKELLSLIDDPLVVFNRESFELTNHINWNYY